MLIDLRPDQQVQPSYWGPSQDIPESLSSIPYAPHSKTDKLGKIADWTATTDQQDRREDMHQNRRGRFGHLEAHASSGSVFTYQHTAEDDSSFSYVSGAQKKSGRAPVRQRQAVKYQRQPASAQQPSSASGTRTTVGGAGARHGAGGAQRRFHRPDRSERVRDSSVKIGAQWEVVEEVDFGRLSKLTFDVPNAVNLTPLEGELCYYDKTFDRVSTRLEKPLQQVDRTFINVTASEDPELQRLAAQTTSGVILSTDSVLSTLMCATRSVYPWDMLVKKRGNRVYVDKRDESTAFDFLTVNETALGPPMESTDKDNVNTPLLLSQEATYIQRNFTQQVIRDDERVMFTQPSPFRDEQVPESEPLPPVAYRYREWSLGDDKTGNPVSVILRTQCTAALHQPGASATQVDQAKDLAYPSNETLLMNAYALNEYDAKAGGTPEWRQKIDSQRGAVLAAELKNNGNKSAKWTVESMLSGVDQIKLGFVSRVSVRDRMRHVILATSSFKPKEFAAQMNLKVENGWGVLKAFADVFMELADGEYCLVKDPNKGILRLYKLPAKE